MALALGSASASITLDVSQMASAGAQAEGVFRRIDAASQASQTGIRSFGKTVSDMEGDITRAGAALAAFGVGVGAALGVAANEFIGFEAAMRNVNSIAGLSDQALSDLGDSVQDLSSSVGKGPTELAEGLYDIQSSGFEAAEGLGILEKAAIAATAGMTDTGTASRAITAVLNAYGKSAEEAGDVSDLLFSTVDKGVLTFEALANNLGQVLPVASALNVPFEQIAAAMATLTLNGISAAQAETALAAAMRSAVNPTAELAAAVQQAGFASAEMAIQTVGLSGYLQILMTASGGSSEALSQLLGTAEATTAVLALMNDGGAGLSQMMSEMSAAMTDGAYAQGVFNEQAKSTAFSLQQLQVAFDNARVTFGEALAPLINLGAGALTAMLNAFSALPGPIQTVVAAMATLAAGTTLFLGTIALAAPRIVELIGSMGRLATAARNSQRAMRLMSLAISPVGLALVAVGAAAYTGYSIWQRHKQAVEDARVAYENLQTAIDGTNDVVRNLNMSGQYDEADQLAEAIDNARSRILEFNDVVGDLDWFANLDTSKAEAAIQDFYGKVFGPATVEHAFKEGYITESLYNEITSGVDGALERATPNLQLAAKSLYKELKLDDATLSEIETSMTPLWELFENPAIDDAKLQEAINGTIDAFLRGEIAAEDLDDAFRYLFDDITIGSDKFNILNDDLGETAITATDLTTALSDIGKLISDLTLQGMGDAARDIDLLNRYLQGMETSVTTTTMVLDEATGRLVPFTATVGLTAEEMAHLGSAIDIVNSALASGNYDNARLLADIIAVLTDPNLDPDQMAAKIEDIVINIDRYIDTSDEAASASELLAAGFANVGFSAGNLGSALVAAAGDMAVATAAARELALALGEGVVNAAAEAGQVQAEAIQEFNDATIEWLGNGENILSFLNSYISESNTAAQASIDMAMSLNQSASALDSVLAIFGEIEALGQRSANANSIADTLIGAPGELGTLQDLWTRIQNGTSVATLEAWEYEAALAAGLEIQESNARVQDYITQIQAQQIPLLAEQQLAYEDNLRALSEMNAAEQQRALYLQSSAGQAQVASAYSTAYAASLGELPESVATELIANAAQADPVLKDTLLSLGLIEEGADGTITVNFPDGPTVQETIIELTRSIDALIVAMGHVPPLHIDSNVKEVTADVRDLVGQGWNASVGVEDNATGPIGAIGNGLDALNNTQAEPRATLDDAASRVAQALQDKMISLDGTLATPGVDIDDHGTKTVEELQRRLDVLNSTTTVHTVEIRQVGNLGMDRGAPDGGAAPAPERPDAGAGNVGTGNPLAAPIVMPAIDTTLFDASVANLATSMQSLLTAVNATFVVAIPANILNGMIAGSTALYSQLVVWQLHFASNLQPILTATNATFAVAIPANVTTGMASATSTIYGNLTQWQAHFGANTQAVLTVVNAVFVTAIPANVSAGMSAATANVQSGVSQWPGIVSSVSGAMQSAGYAAGAAAGDGVVSGLRSRLGAVQAAAAQIAATVASALATSLLIASPSKVTTRLGEFAGDGLANGILNRETEVYSAASRVGRAAEFGLNDYLRHIELDGDWLNDALLSLPKGEEWAAAMREVWGTAEYRDALKSYMEGVIEGGDWNNDMITHLPEQLRDTFAEWGEYIARGLEDASEIANKAAWDASPSNPRNQGKGKWYDPRAGGNQGGSPLEPEPGNGSGTGTPTTPETPDPDAWAKANLKGLIILDEEALKNAGLKADTTVGSIFSKEEVDASLTLKDLFAGRVRVGDSDFMFGDYLEHYGGLIPDEDTAPYPPGTTPPGTKPPGRPGSGVSVEYGQVRPKRDAPNQPNRGSGRGSYDARGTTIYQIDSRQYNELRSGELEKIISDGERGNAAWGTMASGGLRRAQNYGPSRRAVTR